MSRDVISDEVRAVLGPLFPGVKTTGRPPVDRRTVVEATAWRFRTGAPWRDLPERFGNWNTIYKNFDRWSKAGVWARVLEAVQSMAHQAGDVDWVASIDSTIVRPPAWRDPAQGHRGHDRTTRSSAMNPLNTRSVAPAAV
ncbi:transposase [Cellulosimicrobium cellulans]|uniref:transposase n=1 Tax=Cellulosimicrobium cellulans TaxID=1710 RepID=UPI001BA9883D|nr:transposase [Cellulosimicrobium cellulans]QUB99635.1 transposase [Cellulosimicrobium cellulans]